MLRTDGAALPLPPTVRPSTAGQALVYGIRPEHLRPDPRREAGVARQGRRSSSRPGPDIHIYAESSGGDRQEVCSITQERLELPPGAEIGLRADARPRPPLRPGNRDGAVHG